MNRYKPSSQALRKWEELKALLSSLKRVLIAFSGGVDSAFLVKVAHDVLGENVLAVTAASETYPQREIEEASKLAQELGVKHMVIHTDELENAQFVANTPQRCYFCKSELFARLKEIAERKGMFCILDGSNLEDARDFRPGRQAARELGVRSPLMEVGLSKNEIRELSRMLALPTWDKPSFACLSSRIPYYTKIEKEVISRIGQAEDALREMGFRQVRVRHHDQTARIEIDPSDMSRLFRKRIRKRIVQALKNAGYLYVTVDLEGYRSGSMNEPLKK